MISSYTLARLLAEIFQLTRDKRSLSKITASSVESTFDDWLARDTVQHERADPSMSRCHMTSDGIHDGRVSPVATPVSTCSIVVMSSLCNIIPDAPCGFTWPLTPTSDISSDNVASRSASDVNLLALDRGSSIVHRFVVVNVIVFVVVHRGARSRSLQAVWPAFHRHIALRNAPQLGRDSPECKSRSSPPTTNRYNLCVSLFLLFFSKFSRVELLALC